MAALESEWIPVIITKEIIEQKKELKKILLKCGIRDPKKIEKKLKGVNCRNIQPMKIFFLLWL